MQQGKSVRVVMALMLVILASCATARQGVVRLQGKGVEFPEEGRWSACRFRLAWDQKSPADMSMDLLLAAEVLAPVLGAHEGGIYLWRFHRRAAPDKAGHQLSLLFYSTPTMAESIFLQVRESPLLQELLSTRVLTEVLCDTPGGSGRRAIGATSDPAWPEVIQHNWPVYIMGVSALWLGIVQEVAGPPPAGESLDAKLNRYRNAHAEVTRLWRKDGQHAFLHHLNAIFGYEPMWISHPVRF